MKTIQKDSNREQSGHPIRRWPRFPVALLALASFFTLALASAQATGLINASASGTTLSIKGSIPLVKSDPTKPYTVVLNGVTLTVTSSSTTLITATIAPPLAPGSYHLNVTNLKGFDDEGLDVGLHWFFGQ